MDVCTSNYLAVVEGSPKEKFARLVHYLKKDEMIIERARKTKVLERHLDVKIENEIYDELLKRL